MILLLFSCLYAFLLAFLNVTSWLSFFLFRACCALLIYLEIFVVFTARVSQIMTQQQDATIKIKSSSSHMPPLDCFVTFWKRDRAYLSLLHWQLSAWPMCVTYRSAYAQYILVLASLTAVCMTEVCNLPLRLTEIVKHTMCGMLSCSNGLLFEPQWWRKICLEREAQNCQIIRQDHFHMEYPMW
jgi:hypothetical protein